MIFANTGLTYVVCDHNRSLSNVDLVETYLCKVSMTFTERTAHLGHENPLYVINDHFLLP